MRGVALALGVLLGGCVASHEPPPFDPDVPPLPGELREVELTYVQYRTLCFWWMRRHGWEGAPMNPPFYQCPPPPAEREFVGQVGCIPQATDPECAITVQDWYDCENSQPYWWCEWDPPLEVCRRPPNCGPVGAFLP